MTFGHEFLKKRHQITHHIQNPFYAPIGLGCHLLIFDIHYEVVRSSKVR